MQTSLLMQGQLFSPEVFPASPSVLPESGKADRTTASSGRRCWKQFKTPGPLGSLAKMLLGSSAWNSTECSLTWRVSATPGFHLLFQLVPSMRNTEGTESGLWQTVVADDSAQREKGKFNSRGEPKLSAQVKLWPTVKASDGHKCAGGHRGKADTLTSAVKLWPTPTVHGNNNRPGTSAKAGTGLTTAVKLWPTPCAIEPEKNLKHYKTKAAQPRSEKGGGHGPNLATAVKLYPTPKARDFRTGDNPDSRQARQKKSGKYHSPDLNDVAAPSGQLNPTWVEWLMGYPEGWTELSPSEMPSSPKSRSRSSKR